MHLKKLLLLIFAMYSVAAYAAQTRACNDFVPKLPNLKMPLCEAARLVDMQARSVQGRTIWGRDVVADDAKLRVLVIGGIHGDEMSSSALVMHWIALANQPPADIKMPVHWRFVPVLNPDGLFARPARRTNANGVDLNRNFPTPNWARDARSYWENAPVKILAGGPETSPCRSRNHVLWSSR